MALAIAYAWKSGEIGVVAVTEDFQVPSGTIPFACAERASLVERLALRARHAYGEHDYLVPGLPEHDEASTVDPINILIDLTDWAFSDWPLIDFAHILPDGQKATARIHAMAAA
jgi:hypothetical protein